MNKRFPTVNLRRARGLTLIEMMVALTIGLVVVVAVLSAYLGSATAGRMAEAQGRMNEDAQAALAILSQHLRMAGNNPVQPNRVEGTERNPVYLTSKIIPTTFDLTGYAVRGCERDFSNTRDKDATSLDLLNCSGGSNEPDAIAVTYEADRFNTIAAGSEPTDCLGTALPELELNLTTMNTAVGTGTTTTSVKYRVADNRFYIAKSGTGAKATHHLFCKGNGTQGGKSVAAQPLVENVEDLQLFYGTLAPGATTIDGIAGYLSANEVRSNVGPLATKHPNESDRWKQVLAVRICLVVRSENPVVNDAASARYLGCDGEIEKNPPDLRLRRAYTTTVVLRNRE